MNETRCGQVVIVGRPNVGKSTLLNKLLGQKISITSPKPQTTRHRLLGIKTLENTQIIYVDTPGLHQAQHSALNRYLNRTAVASIEGVDVVIWLVVALEWFTEDDYVLKRLHKLSCPVILGVNKIDKISDKSVLLPYLQNIAQKHSFAEIFPLSAQQGDNLSNLETTLIRWLPISPWLFPEDQITDRSERFLVAEIIREKLTLGLGAELPYCLSVEIEQFVNKQSIIHIHAVIWIERPTQKAIVIGKQGCMLKQVGESARKDMEILLGQKVFLQLWVKVKQGWSDDERLLRQLGYT